MRYTPVDNMNGVDTAFCSIQRTFNFWQHPARNSTVNKKRINFTRREISKQLTCFIEYSRNIGQKYQFFRLQYCGKFARHHVCVDVVAFVGNTKSNRTDDRNESIILQSLHHAGINAHNFTHKADVMLKRWVSHVKHFEFLRTNQTAIAAGQANGFSTCLVNQAHNILLNLACEHPFNDFHRFFIRDTHALNEMPFFTQTIQCRLNLRPAAVNHHWIHTDQLEQHYILSEIRLQRGISHSVTTILDDNGLTVKFPDVRQRLRKYLGFVTRRNVGKVRIRGSNKLIHQVGWSRKHTNKLSI